MVTPRTTTRRRILTSPVDTPDNSAPVSLEVDEGTVADVVEHQGTKTFTYQAKVKQNEQANEQNPNDDDDLIDLLDDSESQSPPLPKTALDKLFDDIATAIADGTQDNFYAKLVRAPDSMSDTFLIPCRDMVELGVFQFSSLDRFNFISAIQRANNNSGGRFVVSVHDDTQQPLQVMNPRSFTLRPVGTMLKVENPIKPATPVNQDQQGGNNQLAVILQEMHKATLEGNRAILEAITRKPEQSEIEKVLMQKVLHDIVNPPQQQNNNNGFEQTMASMLAMPAMVDGFARKMFPEPAPPIEPDLIDKATRIMNLPVVQNTIERIVDIADGIAAAKMNTGTPVAVNQEQPHYDNVIEIEANEMTQLTSTILKELEGNNPLDDGNAVVQQLQAEYPDQYGELVDTCKAVSFDNILNLIITRLGKQDPALFSSYIDVAATEATNTVTWTTTGIHVKARLESLYNYLKELPE